MRIRLTIEYDGKPFTGWQRQAQGRSVQAEIEQALEKVLSHRVTLFGSGRTDSGVHALGQVAHFDTENPIPVAKLPRAMLPWLPDAISILEAGEAAPDFDARRDALLRWYRYQICTARLRRPLGPRAWSFWRPLDVDRMIEATRLLQGDHDFKGFRSSLCTAERTRLTMKEASLSRHGADGEMLAFDFKCRSFLQKMVRLMVGAVVGIGSGRFTPDDLIRIRDTGTRPCEVESAPAEGLCLMKIAYTAEEAEAALAAHPPAPSF